MEVQIVRKCRVMVKLPKRLNVKHDEWAMVGEVHASTNEEAISKAVQGAPSLLDYVPAGMMQFMVLTPDVKIQHTLVTERGRVE